MESKDEELAPGYWRNKPLDRMTAREWEALCDGCGRCCLHKLEDEDTGQILHTRVACRLLDIDSCRCSDYPNRVSQVPDCMVLDAGRSMFHWLPSSCAYRRVDEGRDLAWWHPLVSGDPETVHQAGISVRAFALPEEQVHEDDLDQCLADWIDEEDAEDADD